ncbi:hypothetical protein BDL97_03G113100 [Sphagnum fallax]|nr:hypothetical protein BDL97_03G113100 [Sphagnum fallax]
MLAKHLHEEIWRLQRHDSKGCCCLLDQDYVHTGGAVAVHQFCHVDSYSFLAGGSMVDRDVPIYMMVSGDRAELRGLNLEGLWRCGFSDPEVKSIQQTYQKLFMNSDTEAGGLEDRLATLVCAGLLWGGT